MAEEENKIMGSLNNQVSGSQAFKHCEPPLKRFTLPAVHVSVVLKVIGQWFFSMSPPTPLISAHSPICLVNFVNNQKLGCDPLVGNGPTV